MYEFTVKNTNIKVKINQTYHVDDEQYFDYSVSVSYTHLTLPTT